MADRPKIPTELRRRVLIEAGHRCAIPTCKTSTTEIAHIEPWAKVKEHRFENLIALCPTCHTRFDKREIDRISMRQYKSALAIINGRYSEFERRILEYLALNPQEQSKTFVFSHDRDIDLMYLLRDGIIEKLPFRTGIKISGVPSQAEFRLTASGQKFIRDWVQAQNLV